MSALGRLGGGLLLNLYEDMTTEELLKKEQVVS